MPRSIAAAPPARPASLEPEGLPASDRDRLWACHGSRRPPRLCGWGDRGTLGTLGSDGRPLVCLTFSPLISLAPPLYHARRVGVPPSSCYHRPQRIHPVASS